VGKRTFDREIPFAGESEKAHGQVGVVGGERGIDLARRNRGVERARDRVIGERHRIVLGSEQELRLEGARRGGPRGERECNGERKWHSDTRRGHRIVPATAIDNIVFFVAYHFLPTNDATLPHSPSSHGRFWGRCAGGPIW